MRNAEEVTKEAQCEPVGIQLHVVEGAESHFLHQSPNTLTQSARQMTSTTQRAMTP